MTLYRPQKPELWITFPLPARPTPSGRARRESAAKCGRAFSGEDPQTLPEPDSLAEAFIQMALPDWTANGERVEASSIR